MLSAFKAPKDGNMTAYTVRVITPSTLVYLGIELIAKSLGEEVSTVRLCHTDTTAPTTAEDTPHVDVIDTGIPQDDLRSLLKTIPSGSDNPRAVLILKRVTALSLSILRSGQFSAFLEDSPVEEIRYVIDSAYRKKRRLSRDVSDAIAMLSIDTEGSALSLLSPREIEVLHHLHRGFQPQEIAKEFGISAKTIHVYKSKIMDKTGCTRMHEVINMALKHGLI